MSKTNLQLKPLSHSLKSLPHLSQPTQPMIKRRLNVGRTPAGKRNYHTIEFRHEVDPKTVILDKIGKIDDGVMQLSRILIAVYQPPAAPKTQGGLILLDTATEEDLEEYLWQGKVGLIVAMGPQAYVDDDVNKFHGTKNSIGDWVWFRPSDGIQCDVNGVFCRIMTEASIIGKIPHPDYVW